MPTRRSRPRSPASRTARRSATSGVTGSAGPSTHRHADEPRQRQPLRDHRRPRHAGGRQLRLQLRRRAARVAKATLTVTADDQSRLYGDANPTLDGHVHRLQERRDTRHKRRHGRANALHHRRRRRVRSAAVPTRSRRPSARSCVGNYDFSFVAGQLDVTKATLTVTADDQSRTLRRRQPDASRPRSPASRTARRLPPAA